MDVSSSRKHHVRSAGPVFPYGKSIGASLGLLIGTMFFLAAMTDPRSGEIRPTGLAWLTIAGLPAGIAAMFYTESRSRKKRAFKLQTPARQLGGRGQC